MFLAAGDTEWP